jgi:hypothetical protein
LDSQSIHGSDDIQVLVKDSPYTHIEIGGRNAAQLWVPPLRQAGVAPRKDLDLLLGRFAITDLAGRGALWQDCLDWCGRPDPVSIRCITGHGGCGKTRFALELLHHLRGKPNWDARFVSFSSPEPFDFWKKTHGSNQVLLVFDYAGDVAAPLAESLRGLVRNPPENPQRRLRILLLARTASWDTGWLASLKPSSTVEPSVAELFDPSEPLVLNPLNQPDRIAVFAQALKKAAAFAKLPEPPLPDPALFAQPRAEETLRDPLALIMAAVVGIRNGVPQALSLTRVQLAYEAAEILVAQRLTGAFPENAQMAHHMAAYVTLCGGLSKRAAQDALAVEARENNLGAIANPGAFIDKLHTWFPGEKTDLGAIEPDVVGEAFLLGTKSPRLVHPEESILRATAQGARKAVDFLMRAAQDLCLTDRDIREEPLRWLGRLIAKGEADDFSLLVDIESAMPESTVVLRPHALYVTELVLERLRPLAASMPDGEENGAGPLSEIARILNNLAARQADVGQREQALGTAREAVALYRKLLERNRDSFLPSLAMSLNNLANRQSDVGQREQALGTAQEAAALYRKLLERNRDAFLPNLASSLHNLAKMQSQMGQPERALETAQEAVSLRRELVERNHDAFLPNLAMSLNNLASFQSDVGQREQALDTAQEAAVLYRELVERNRDAFLPYLATSLDNLSNRQSEVGQREQALGTAQEAAALYRERVERNRDAFLPDLARSLNNLARRQSEVGQREQALGTAQEAAALYRELVERSCDAFAVDLGRSLGSLGQILSGLRRAPEAAQAFAEGLRTTLPYVERYPQALVSLAAWLLPDYIMALRDANLDFDAELVAEAMRVLGPYLSTEKGASA